MQRVINPEPTVNKVVAHYQNGTVVKGWTRDFKPDAEHFHILENWTPGAEPRRVRLPELKAVFFVKDLAGDLGHAKSNIFDPADRTPGRKVRVLFKDGEVMMGYTPDYEAERPGFFVLPADLRSNADRCFLVTAATERISLISTVS